MKAATTFSSLTGELTQPPLDLVQDADMVSNAKTNLKKMADLEATAYHEAGHAVAAFQLGIRIGRRGVSIIPAKDGSLGLVDILKGFRGRPDIMTSDRMRLGAEKQAIVSFVGEIAQRKFRPRSVRRDHGWSDRYKTTDLMGYFVATDKELRAYLKWLHIRAELFVSSPYNWSLIEAVAAMLLERKRLSAEEVKDICLTVSRG